MKGYKVMNPDWTCKEHKFEIGKTYSHKGQIEMCRSGFHFCARAVDCFNYYSFNPDNVVCEVEAIGIIVEGDDKNVTSKIKIIKQLAWSEVLNLLNTGRGNTGKKNSGDSNSGNRNSGNSNSGSSNSGNSNSGNSNSGNRNSGNRNSGSCNSGNSNSGNSNSGYRNSGYRNSGNRNSGNRNSGDRNSGDRNSGNWNSGNSNSGDSNSGYRNSGAFCTDNDPKIFLFDMPTKMTVREWEQSEAYRIMSDLLELSVWISSDNMTDKQKEKHPSYETNGGYLKSNTMKEAWADMWGNLNDDKKKVFAELPNFDAKKFLEITGLELEKL